MTAPIQEPTSGRDISGLGYGARQLFRRPAPVGGENTIPGFHAETTPSLVCSTGNQAQITWERWWNDDDTIFEDGVITGGNLTEVKFMQPGWYASYCSAHWVSQPATGFGGLLFLYDNTDYSAPNYHTMGVTYPVNWSSSASMTIQEVRYFPAEFVQTQSFAFVQRLETWVIQNSGVNRTIGDAYLNIAYLGARAEGAFS